MIEVLKQALEALKEYVNVVVSVNDPNDWRTVADGGKPAREAITSLRQAIAELKSQEPQIKTTDPFESARVRDYNRGWNDCLFASGIVKQSQRTWQGLTDKDIKTICSENGWDSSWQSLRFAQAIEAKLKERNL